MSYTIDYFINKFSKIPSSKWHTGFYYNDQKTRFCALGHCYYGIGSNGRLRDKGTKEVEALCSFFHKHSLNVADVNDQSSKKFPQKTPRGRILAALRSFKK